MTFPQRLRPIFRSDPPSPVPASLTLATPISQTASQQPANELTTSVVAPNYSQPGPLPDWLVDEESLRDEGVLFGLSTVQPDEKIAEIRACFTQQSAHLTEQIDEHTEQLGEVNRLLEQHEKRLQILHEQIVALRDSQPVATGLVRTMVSLLLLVGMCVGTFYLIDETLRIPFPNRWIAVGVFLAGMFNGIGRLSVVHETNAKLTSRRLVEEAGLPLATAVFILTQALQTQPASQAIGLFVFVFFLCLLAGKLVLNTLTTLQTDLNTIRVNRQLAVDKQTNLPRLEANLEQLRHVTGTLRMQKRSIITVLGQVKANSTQLNARRDQLINLFLGEFELARSIRDRLTKQQREAIFN